MATQNKIYMPPDYFPTLTNVTIPFLPYAVKSQCGIILPWMMPHWSLGWFAENRRNLLS